MFQKSISNNKSNSNKLNKKNIINSKIKLIAYVLYDVFVN